MDAKLSFTLSQVGSFSLWHKIGPPLPQKASRNAVEAAEHYSYRER
jgi:hypothetical protein